MANKLSFNDITVYLSNLHHDLLIECLKLGVLVHATTPGHTATDFESGLHEMLLDAEDRLQGICDKIEKFDEEISKSLKQTSNPTGN